MFAMRVRFLFALGLFSWGCSDGSYSPGAAPQGPSSPPPSVVAPVDMPVQAGPAPPIVILEKGKLNWPLDAVVDGASSGFVFATTPDEDVGFSFATESKHVEILTHAHFDMTAGHQSILVRAKASQPVAMLVTIAELGDAPYDYWSQLDAGHPWRVANMAVDTTWTDIEVPIASLQPMGAGTPQGFAGTALGVNLFAFLLTNPAASQVWFEHIEIR